MSEKGPLYMISESSNVRLGLMLTLIISLLGGTVWLTSAIHSVKADVVAEMDKRVANHVSTDYFNVRMDAQRDSLADVKASLVQLDNRLREVERKQGK